MSTSAELQQLESAPLRKLIQDGVRYAQSWLPPGWTIPGFYFPVIPNGGSPAFSIGDAQGYDFFQLPEDAAGKIDLQNLVGRSPTSRITSACRRPCRRG